MKEIISAKIAPGTAHPNVDRAALRHYFEAPTDMVGLSQYLWRNFPTGNTTVSNSYRRVAYAEVTSNEVGPIRLEQFRAQYLAGTKVPVQSLVVREISSNDGPVPNPATIQLPVSRAQLQQLLAQEIDRLL